MNRFLLQAITALAFTSASLRGAQAQQAVSPSTIKEYMEVVGSDGQHVGTVDKVDGDAIALTRNESAAGGQHHAIPLAWAGSVAGQKLMLNQTAQEAQRNWNTTEAPPADKK